MFYVGLSHNIKNPQNWGALSFSVDSQLTAFLDYWSSLEDDLSILELLTAIYFKVSIAVPDAG